MYAGKLLFMDGGNLFIFEWLAMASIFHSLYIVISPAVGEYGEIMAVPAWHYQLILLYYFSIYFSRHPLSCRLLRYTLTFPPRSAINGNFRMIKVHG